MDLHMLHMEKLLETKITRVGSGRTLAGLAIEQAHLPNHRQRWCTRMLKIEPYQQYLATIAPAVSYVGIRADEVENREGVDHGAMDGISNRYPFVEWGWGIKDVYAYLDERGVTVPARTDCGCCFFGS